MVSPYIERCHKITSRPVQKSFDSASFLKWHHKNGEITKKYLYTTEIILVLLHIK